MRNSASGPAETKSDQPMVTIKRVMRPDTSEPTVTISVKREEKDAEKVREDKPKKKSEKEKTDRKRGEIYIIYINLIWTERVEKHPEN